MRAEGAAVIRGADASEESRAVLRLEGVSYGVAGLRIIDGIDAIIGRGLPTVLMGPNGSGKTTLLKLMMSLLKAKAGIVELGCRPDGAPLRRAFVFQKPVMLRRSARDNIAFALSVAGRATSAAAIDGLLETVGLLQLGERPARRLSGGEQQRLALARALAMQPDVLLLDEPTASLDPAQTHAVEGIIRGIAEDGVKIIMATHDRGQALRLGGDVLFLVAGHLVEQSPASQFFASPRTQQARRFIDGELVL